MGTTVFGKPDNSDDLVSTRATIFEVTVSCWIPNLQSPPPMFHKMSQVQNF